VLLVAACRQEPAAPWQPRAVFHDFGMIPHGEVATARLRIDLPRDRGPMVPLGFRGPCACASHRFVTVGADGRERVSHGRPTSEYAVLPGEPLYLELSIDTRRKEASEQKPLTNSGEVLVTDLADRFGQVIVPVSFVFGIEAPVVLSPFAHIDFGALPLSRRFSMTVELRAKTGTHVQFREPRVADPRVTAVLRSDGDVALLDVRVVPDRGLGLGAVHTTVEVPTDLGDYVVPLPVTGQIVDDVEVKPMERISFGRFDMKTAQEGSVLLRDYDTSRAAEFVVLRLRGVVGKDLARHFRAEIEPDPSDERSARLVLRYLGTFPDRTFRGFVDLGKRGSDGTVASIEFVGFGHE
jgi:hypothetical protein